jgi:hypothetical protein
MEKVSERSRYSYWELHIQTPWDLKKGQCDWVRVTAGEARLGP